MDFWFANFLRNLFNFFDPVEVDILSTNGGGIVILSDSVYFVLHMLLHLVYFRILWLKDFFIQVKFGRLLEDLLVFSPSSKLTGLTLFLFNSNSVFLL